VILSAKNIALLSANVRDKQFLNTSSFDISKFNEETEGKDTMKNIVKLGSISLGLGLMLTTLGQAQQANSQGAPSAAPLSFKVPPHASSAISFSIAPNAQCSVAPATDSSSAKAFTVYANDEGTVTFYATPSQESSAVQLVATCSSGNRQTIEIQPVAGAKPLVPRDSSNAETDLRFGHTVRPALTGDPMALSSQELVKRGYPSRPDPKRAPGAYASWLRAVSKPATFIPPKTVNVEGRHHGPAKVGNDPGGSANWSGYALSGLGVSSPFDRVVGLWNVPGLVSGENWTTTYSSFWIGLDGWDSGDVVQDGTTQDETVWNGIAYKTYYPWKEIWPQEYEQELSNFGVSPGDEIYSEVAMVDSNGNLTPWGGYGSFLFEDLTTGQYTHLSTQFNSGTYYGVNAEWIMERPIISGGYPDLSDYWFAVMQDPYAGTWDGNYTGYLGPGEGDVSYQLTMYNGNDALSTVYPINSDEMEFIWLNYR
jgi:hypothetical protein